MFLISRLHLNYHDVVGKLQITRRYILYPDIPVHQIPRVVPSHGSLRGTCQSRFVSRRSGD